MQQTTDLELRAAVQIALLGVVTKSIRAVSFDIEPEKHLIHFRVHFDGHQHEVEIENMSAAATEIAARYPWGWDMKEEFLTCQTPEKPEFLRLVGYVRCESPDFLPPA